MNKFKIYTNQLILKIYITKYDSNEQDYGFKII